MGQRLFGGNSVFDRDGLKYLNTYVPNTLEPRHGNTKPGTNYRFCFYK